ncbi:MAG: hypothetical protein AAF764_09135 [Pseudomonadota bacterium]
MLTSSLKSAFVAGAIALGAITTTAATTTAAHAGDVRFGVSIGGPGYGIHVGNRDRRYRRHRGFYHDDYRPRRAARCRPARALRKARRNGIRRAHIIRTGRRGVVVAGRQWGDRVVIGFGRHRSCPVRFVRHR